MTLSSKIRVWGGVVLGAAAASPAWAEEGGLPQLDTSWYANQVFWLAVTFSVLYVLMSHIALPRVAKTQDARKGVISGEIEAARKASDEAKAMVAAADASLKDARAKAHADVNALLAQVSEDANRQQAKQEEELQLKLAKIQTVLADEREAAMRDVSASAADIAALVVTKILGSKGRVNA